MTKLIFFLPLIMEFFRKTQPTVKESIRDEILLISIKLFSGLILTSVIIFALISMGQQLNLILLALEYGQIYSLLAMALLTISCALGLALLLKTKAALKTPPAPLLNEFGIDLSKIISTFCDGLSEGLEKSKQEPKPPTLGTT